MADLCLDWRAILARGERFQTYNNKLCLIKENLNIR